MSRIELVTVGDELVEGRLVDTNSAAISARLAAEGLAVARHQSVGDDRSELVGTLRRCAERCDVVLVTGGLGPTCDDLTASCAADAFAAPLERSEEALDHVRSFFADRGRRMTTNNEKQADLPLGSRLIPNPNGTAVGFALKVGRCDLFFMPGVPRELRAMLEASILPELRECIRPARPAISTLKLFGRGESEVAALLDGLDRGLPEGVSLKIQYRATFPEIHIRLVVEGAGEVDDALRSLTEEAADRLGRHVFAVGGPHLETGFAEVVASELHRSEARVAVADGCTGGVLSRLLLSYEDEETVRGALAAPVGRLLDELTPDGTRADGRPLDEKSVEALAAAVRTRFGATHGVAIVGSPEGGPDLDAGAMVAAVSCSPTTAVRRLQFPVERDRFQVLGAYVALTLLRRTLGS